jgi:hypothetical protein
VLPLRGRASDRSTICCGSRPSCALWLVGAAANAVRWLELLVSGVFAREATHSALEVTAVVAARQLPQLALGAFAGAVSEAVNRKLIVMLALVVPAVISTLLATLATTAR